MSTVAFKGIGEVVATFDLAGNVDVGTVVNVTKEGSVTKAAANSAFLGVVRNFSANQCAVQLDGYIEASYTGTKPAFGNVILASNGGTGVRVHTEGRSAHVVSIDEYNGIVGFFFI